MKKLSVKELTKKEMEQVGGGGPNTWPTGSAIYRLARDSTSDVSSRPSWNSNGCGPGSEDGGYGGNGGINHW